MIDDNVKIFKTEKATIRVTFTNQSKEEQERVLRNFAEASFKLAKVQYERGLTNENNNDEGTIKLT